MSLGMLLRTTNPRRIVAARRTRGFTLIEAAIVTAIVGIGIVAMMQLLAAGTMANTESAELTTAMGLASNIHERAVGTPYDELFTKFDNKSYSPPLDAKENPISGMSTWQQVVDVQYVDPDNARSAVPDTQPEPISRITVLINHNGRPLYTASWLMANGDQE